MAAGRARRAVWLVVLLALAAALAWVIVHRPFATDSDELLSVALSEEDPELDRVGDLKFLGGLDIPRMGQNIGGLSGLRWDAESGRLLAITDDARWVWMDLREEDKRLVGIDAIESGPLLGVDGEPLRGKEQGDSESLARLGSLPWNIGFERDHRILIYDDGLSSPPTDTQFSPVEVLGALEHNNGLEAMAFAHDRLLVCAERQATTRLANCVKFEINEGDFVPFSVEPPSAIVDLGGVPTDADATSDGAFLILFRSYSRVDGSGAAIVAYAPDGTRRELATLRPPLTADNFEGIAVREEGDDDEGRRTFLYIVSDDNFSGDQRTLLMKFEVLPEAQ